MIRGKEIQHCGCSGQNRMFLERSERKVFVLLTCFLKNLRPEVNVDNICGEITAANVSKMVKIANKTQVNYIRIKAKETYRVRCGKCGLNDDENHGSIYRKRSTFCRKALTGHKEC